jgi:hypothetical protein
MEILISGFGLSIGMLFFFPFLLNFLRPDPSFPPNRGTNIFKNYEEKRERMRYLI